MLAVLAVAVALRLWSAWHARFSSEEAAFWNTAVGIARAEEFPSLGTSVSGTRALHPGPLFFWIIALSQLFVTSPLVGTLDSAPVVAVALVRLTPVEDTSTEAPETVAVPVADTLARNACPPVAVIATFWLVPVAVTEAREPAA